MKNILCLMFAFGSASVFATEIPPVCTAKAKAAVKAIYKLNGNTITGGLRVVSAKAKQVYDLKLGTYVIEHLDNQYEVVLLEDECIVESIVHTQD